MRTNKAEYYWELHTKHFLTIQEIAFACGVHKTTVTRVLKNGGYQARLWAIGRNDPRVTNPDEFKLAMSTVGSWTALGKKLDIPHRSAKWWATYHGFTKKDFGFELKGEHSPHWGNGYKLDGYGYVEVSCEYIGYNVFNPKWISRYVPVHKVVVEMTILGMVLPSNYCVHHLDYDKQNNTQMNLVILTNSQHRTIHNYYRKLDKLRYTMDEFNWISVYKRLQNMALIWSAANLTTLKVERYLQVFDLYQTSPMANTNNDLMFHLLDHVPGY